MHPLSHPLSFFPSPALTAAPLRCIPRNAFSSGVHLPIEAPKPVRRSAFAPTDGYRPTTLDWHDGAAFDTGDLVIAGEHDDDDENVDEASEGSDEEDDGRIAQVSLLPPSKLHPLSKPASNTPLPPPLQGSARHDITDANSSINSAEDNALEAEEAHRNEIMAIAQASSAAALGPPPPVGEPIQVVQTVPGKLPSQPSRTALQIAPPL